MYCICTLVYAVANRNIFYATYSYVSNDYCSDSFFSFICLIPCCYQLKVSMFYTGINSDPWQSQDFCGAWARRNVILRPVWQGSGSSHGVAFFFELKPFWKTFDKNSLSDNFVIICVRIVRRNRGEPHFYGSGSSIKMALAPLGSMQGAVY